MCSSFFSALWLVAFFSLWLCCHAHSLAALCWTFLFVCFWESHFADKKNIIELVRWVYIYKLYQHASIRGEMCPIFNFCWKYFWPLGKLTWLGMNIFNWIVETDLKDDFVMCYFLWGSWIVKIVSCFCPMVLWTYHNRELLIACPHSPLWFKIITTTRPNIFNF